MDAVVLCALVHHVCITGNVPVREFLDWLRSLDAALVIEFPDRADPMVQRLLSGKREGSNPDYQKALFERALEERFAIERSVPVSETDALRGPPAGVSARSPGALHLGGLWALAFAQPLFDLLGRNAEFFARGSTAGDILLLAFGYALPPLIGAGVVWGAGRSGGARMGVMLTLVALIVAGFLLPPAGTPGGPRRMPLALSPAPARRPVRRASGVRSFATVSPAPLIVLVLFLVVSPVRGLLFPSAAGGAVAGPSRSTVPIVHVVLDELPQATLGDANGRIDAELFPNFARLAGSPPGIATPRRSTTPPRRRSPRSSPANSRGRARCRPRGTIRSLFTLFERSHELTVIEPITACAPRASATTSGRGRWTGCAIARVRPGGSRRSTCCCRPTCARASAHRPGLGGFEAGR